MMPEQSDYYALLGVNRDATSDEIRRAYHRVVRLIHPDMTNDSGATEAFLQIQTAYEVLSNPQKRAGYDQNLPQESNASLPVIMTIGYSRNNLICLDERQLIYVLLELSSPPGATLQPSPPLNLSLVIDRSTSMQGECMDTVKRSAIELLRLLKPYDVLSIITFSDRAEILLPPTLVVDSRAIEAKIKLIQTGGGTEILHGLETGLVCVRSKLSKDYSNQIILLTDGRTYGDEAACLELAGVACEHGIVINGIGLGEAWNDVFLDELASRTGGNSTYIANSQDIGRVLTEKIKDLGQAYAKRVRLDLQMAPGVELRDIFRISPDAQPLPHILPIQLGIIQKSPSLNILLEFILAPIQDPEVDHLIAQGTIHYDVPALLAPEKSLPLRLSRPVTDTKTVPPPPTRLLEVIARLNMYRMQDRAKTYLAEGHIENASRNFQHLATHLFSCGEHALARAVLQEVGNIERRQGLSESGKKLIKYGTRALLLPGGRSGSDGSAGGRQ